MATYAGFTEGVLRAAGLPLTRTNVDFFNNVWIPSEGTRAAFNPLATTRRWPGSTAFNAVGVRNFKTPQDGIRATAETLRNGYYGPILALLERGNASMSDLARAVQQSPWGTKQGLIGKLAAQRAGAGKQTTFSSSAAAAPIAAPTEVNTGGASGANPFTRRQAFAQLFLGEAQAGKQNTTRWLQGLLGALAIDPDEASPRGAILPKTGTGPVPDLHEAPNPKPVDGILYTSKGWTPTHVTDGLGWGTKTAADIMASPGTAVAAPEDGRVIRWGSAQGGEALYFRGASGKTYWMGHIDNRLPVGSLVRADQPIARVSKDHPRPHLHIDRR